LTKAIVSVESLSSVYLIIGIGLIFLGFVLLLVILPWLYQRDHRYEKENMRNIYPPQDLVARYSGFLILVGAIVLVIYMVADYTLKLSKS